MRKSRPAQGLIEQLAEQSNYMEVAYLLVHGELPTKAELKDFTAHVTLHTYLHENVKKLMEGFRHDAHPMGMLVGSVGYILSLGVTAWAFYSYGRAFDSFGSLVILVSLLVFIAAHAFGQGAVIWVFISEIFPNRVRARGQALGSFVHWVMAALISWTFPVIAAQSGGHVFAFYSLCCVGQLLWVLLVMPETKGISLEKIQQKLGIE